MEIANIMKIRISFKTPDAVDYAIEHLDENVRNEIKEDLATWIKYGESIKIEFDTDEKTATVLPAS